MKAPKGLPTDMPSDRAVVLGVLNVTPDSFSDGGRFLQIDAAIAHGLDLVQQGADIIDIGGESTRPGATPVDPRVEQDRVLPVVRGLVAEGARVSIDTMHATTARLAVEQGACLINDVSGGRFDASMYQTVAALGVPFVLMHWRGLDVRNHTHYEDPVAEVRAEFLQAVERAVDAGVDPATIVMDPGLGFAKEGDTNWVLLRERVAVAAGYPMLIGASRKRFLGSLLAQYEPRPIAGRDIATHVISALACDVWGIRVHDVQGTRDALAVAQSMEGNDRG